MYMFIFKFDSLVTNSLDENIQGVLVKMFNLPLALVFRMER